MNLNNKIFLPVILLTAALAVGCGSGGGEFPPESGYSQADLALGNVNRFAGIVTTSGETKIEKDPSQTVASVSVAPGDSVQKGQVLFTYDGTEAQNNYNKALIELEQMQIGLDSYNAQKTDLEREKAAAPQEEQLSYTVEIQELDTAIREAGYNITQKQKEVEDLQKALNNLEVYSPSDGKIQSVNNSDSDGTMADLPFIVLVQTSAYRVKALVSEENIYDISKGDPVLIRSRIDDRTWNGTVTSIDFGSPEQSQSNGFDSMESEGSVTGTASRYPIYVELESNEGLLLGQHVFVEKIGSSEPDEIPEDIPDVMLDPDLEGSSELE